jgi:hypothetical protein
MGNTIALNETRKRLKLHSYIKAIININERGARDGKKYVKGERGRQ